MKHNERAANVTKNEFQKDEEKNERNCNSRIR